MLYIYNVVATTTLEIRALPAPRPVIYLPTSALLAMLLQVVPGQQSLPLFRLPLMLTAQRKFTYDGALLDVRLAVYRGAPGDTALGPGAAAAGPARSEVAVGQGQHEDIPGVPSAAWVRVQRGVPPADPYTPGAHARQRWCLFVYVSHVLSQHAHPWSAASTVYMKCQIPDAWCALGSQQIRLFA